MGQLFQRLGPWRSLRWPLLGCLFLAVLAAVAESLAPVVLGHLIDRFLVSPHAVWWAFSAYALALLSYVTIERWSSYVELKIAGLVQKHVQGRLYADLLRSNTPFSEEESPEKAARMQQASQAAYDLFRAALVGPFRISVSIMATSILAMMLHPILGWIALVWSLLLIGASIVIHPRAGDLAAQEQKHRAFFLRHVANSLGVHEALKRQKAISNEINKGINAAHLAERAHATKARYLETRLGAMGVLQALFVLTILAVGIYFWQQGVLSPGDVAAAVGLAIALMDNLDWAGQNVSQSLASYGVLSSVLEEWVDPQRQLWLPRAIQDEPSQLEEGQPFVFDSVYTKALKNFQWDLNPGEHTAIVGSYEARQSLLRLWEGIEMPDDGELLWGGAKWMPQEHPFQFEEVETITSKPIVLDRSVEDNISLQDDALVATDSRWDSLLSFVTRLPMGWKTQMGRYAPVVFSTEQMLRIALARALADPPAWLLVEDWPQGEPGERLWKDLAPLLDKTTLIVSIRDAHDALVFPNMAFLAQGRVVEEGSPSDLLVHGKHFPEWLRSKKNLTDQQ